jgi:hypothetical protein
MIFFSGVIARIVRSGESSSESALRVEAQLEVLCADLHDPVSPEAYRDAIPEIRRASPHVGVANLMSLLPCAFWSSRRRLPGSCARSRVRRFSWSPAAAIRSRRRSGACASRSGSAGLDVESDVHTAYGNGDECTRRIVERVFVARELPESPARCP